MPGLPFTTPTRRLGGRKPEGPPSGTQASRPTSRGLRSAMSVLVVDDVADTRELYERYMQMRGVQVTTAEDGAAALHAVAAARPDVVVLDLAMPRITGLDVIKSLKGNPETRVIPIVVLSGQNAREVALAAGAESYLEKPCLPDDLFQEVLRVLREPPAGRNGH